MLFNTTFCFLHQTETTISFKAHTVFDYSHNFLQKAVTSVTISAVSTLPEKFTSILIFPT